MPTYEYECEKCGKVFEEFQSMLDEPLTRCKNNACKGKVHRLLSGGAGFLFKGSGFYITDYRSDSYKKAAKSESGNSGSSEKKESKTEKKSTPSDGGATTSSSNNSGSTQKSSE